MKIETVSDFKTYKVHNFISQGPGLRSKTEIFSNGENIFVNNTCQCFISKRLRNAFLNLLVMAVYVMKLTGKPLSNTYQQMRDFSWENVNTQPLSLTSKFHKRSKQTDVWRRILRSTYSQRDFFSVRILFPEEVFSNCQ